ncbi:MAG: hypothetical protein AAFQ71_11550 [Planctomycetota bacterium]
MTILAQRGSGPYRASICRAHPQQPQLVICLDRLDLETMRYETVAVFEPERFSNAIEVLSMLRDATPEAARALDVEAEFLRRDAA